MAIDYGKIREENNGFYGTKGAEKLAALSANLYREREHFIYELLQNAEDALERRAKHYPESVLPQNVSFQLYHDRLEFSHYGILFSPEDVRGLLEFGEGTKEHDGAQIGKFGIGFKSVYAFTEMPEIHSGPVHFLIKNFVFPEEVEPRTHDDMTLFVFPFKDSKVSSEETFLRIGQHLRGLRARSLLFLRHIDAITWAIDGGETGKYERQHEIRPGGRHVKLLGDNDEECWLVYERKVGFPNGVDTGHVEIAFRLQEGDRVGKNIKCLAESPLYVYFPTSHETGLGFLAQGPYETTPNRDNILKDSHWNRRLVEETAELFAESLRHLKTENLLNVESLQALPTRMRRPLRRYDPWVPDYESDWMPLYDRTRAAFLQEALLPTADGGFVSARNAKLARGVGLRKLLADGRLSTLLDSDVEVEWLSEDLSPQIRDYAIHSLKIEVVDPELFARNLTEDFLRTQPNEWFVEFYNFLGDQEALWKPGGALRDTPFLRLEDDKLFPPFKGGRPCVYMPPEGQTDLPVVKRCIANETKDFLAKLGLNKPDEYDDVIDNVLSNYSASAPPTNTDIYVRDVQRVMDLLDGDSRSDRTKLIERVKKTQFVLCRVGNDSTMKVPTEVYLEKPELVEYFRNARVAFMDTTIASLASADKWKLLGCSDSLKIARLYGDGLGHVYLAKLRGHYRRGLDNFDPDIRVPGLSEAVRCRSSLYRSRFIWNCIARQHSNCIRGTIEDSTLKDFQGSVPGTYVSDFGELLRANEWLPDRNGSFCKPSDLGLDDLPEGFIRDEALADQLGMKKNVVAKHAGDLGICIDVLLFVQRNEDQIRQLMQSQHSNGGDITPQMGVPVAPRNEPTHSDSVQTTVSVPEEIMPARRKRPEITDDGPSDRKRRITKVRELYREAPLVVHIERLRLDRETAPEVKAAKTYLANAYTVDEILYCQMCDYEMPFKIGNDYYFQAVQVWDDPKKEMYEAYLALCPVCAAKYRFLFKTDVKLVSRLKERLVETDNEIRFQIELRGQSQPHFLTFRKKHLIDLQTILREEAG